MFCHFSIIPHWSSFVTFDQLLFYISGEILPNPKSSVRKAEEILGRGEDKS